MYPVRICTHFEKRIPCKKENHFLVNVKSRPGKARAIASTTLRYHSVPVGSQKFMTLFDNSHLRLNLKEYLMRIIDDF